MDINKFKINIPNNDNENNYSNDIISANENEKIIIIMRHGERTDLAGEEVKINISDPELTEIGKEQAFNAGRRLKQILDNMYIEKSNTNVSVENITSKKIAIISSPFSRTLETAKYAKE